MSYAIIKRKCKDGVEKKGGGLPPFGVLRDVITSIHGSYLIGF